ncbi:MAG: ion channel [Pyrinomonadaceae bacterium]
MAENIVDNLSETTELSDAEKRDLGFGSVVTSSSQRLLNHDGTFNVRRTGLSALSSLNLYHTLLAMKWRTFLLIILVLYFVSNVVFGAFYSILGPDSLVDVSSTPTENLFVRGFFFSVQTFATIGYGTIHPSGIVSNLIVTIESYYSLLANALITGLVFARFARPTAKIRFSEIAIVAPYRGITGLMVRLVNGRNNQLIDVKANLLYARFVEENGRMVRRFDALKLERDNVAFLPLAWTIVHPITKDSPLYGITREEVERTDAELLVLINATDETFAAIVHTRSSYKPHEVRVGYKFANIYNDIEDGQPISIDIRKLSLAIPAELPVLKLNEEN